MRQGTSAKVQIGYYYTVTLSIKKISPFLSFKYSGSIKTTPSARTNNTLLLKCQTCFANLLICEMTDMLLL